MKNTIKKFLTKIIICAALLLIPFNVSFAASNISNGDVGNFGIWATEHNRQLFVNNLKTDVDSFQSEFQTHVLVKDYVPVDAKLGNALIGGMSILSHILEKSLIPFINIFLIALFTFWVFLESYQMMKSDSNAKKLVQEIIKKLLLISIWMIILNLGPARLFMLLMGPVVQIGTYFSDLILNSIANTSGISLPDTCDAIHKYVENNQTNAAIINPKQTADILCVPTRLSGFFYTAVSAGWKWMSYGIGNSMLTFTAGAVFVVLFIYNIWKFAFMSLSVIFDMFLALVMLPLTAVTECFVSVKGSSSDESPFGVLNDLVSEKSTGKGTNYDGYAGQIFNKFLELFRIKPVSEQIRNFIQITIYFVSLSIVIGLCAALLAGTVDINMATSIPSVENNEFMTVLIVGALVAYLATQADKIAKKIGGSIDESFGQKVQGDVKNIWGKTKNKTMEIYKILRKTK